MTLAWRRAAAARSLCERGGRLERSDRIGAARSDLKFNNLFALDPALCALFHIRLTSLPVCCFGCDKSLALSPSAHWVGPANDQLPMQQCGKRWVIAGGELARACCACRCRRTCRRNGTESRMSGSSNEASVLIVDPLPLRSLGLAAILERLFKGDRCRIEAVSSPRDRKSVV